MDNRSPRLIAFAGSLRGESYNKKLVQNVAAGARRAGAEVRYIDLNGYPLPVYNADIYDAAAADPHALHDRGGGVGGPHSKPMPDGLLKLKEHFRWADGWLVSTPEHNSTYPGAFHNLVDWLTRLAPGERPLDNFTYKVVGVVSAAYPGNGLGAIADVKRILTLLGCVIVPGGDVFPITNADEMFDPMGVLRNDGQRKTAELTGKRVVDLVRQVTLPKQAS